MDFSADTVIALCALTLTLVGVYETRKNARLSVTPYIIGSRGRTWNNDGLIYTYDLCNYGIGPARIKRFVLLVNNHEFVPPEDVEPLEAITEKAFGSKIRYSLKKHSIPGAGYVIPVGQIYRVVEIHFPGLKKQDSLDLKDRFESVELRVEYESLYKVPNVFDSRGRDELEK